MQELIHWMILIKVSHEEPFTPLQLEIRTLFFNFMSTCRNELNYVLNPDIRSLI